jgi:hypothetical protein
MPFDVTEDIGIIILRKCKADGSPSAFAQIWPAEVDFLAAELSADLGTPLEFARNNVALLGSMLDERLVQGDYERANGLPRVTIDGDDLLRRFRRKPNQRADQPKPETALAWR